MNKARLEAFSDGVIAIIITIMVLELKAPHGTDFSALLPLLPAFISYLVSINYVGIYWTNHHHMLSTVKQVNGRILWANLHLLFWLSLIPFTTAWMGENHFTTIPLVLYGFVLLMAAIAYFLLQKQRVHKHGRNSQLAKAVGRDLKGKLSPLFYIAAMAAAFFNEWVSEGIYVAVALLWLVPDKRIERTITEEKSE